MDAQKLKLIGGAIIVIIAICMMSGDLAGYFAGLGRMATLIGTVVILAVVAAAVLRFLRPKKRGTEANQETQGE